MCSKKTKSRNDVAARGATGGRGKASRGGEVLSLSSSGIGKHDYDWYVTMDGLTVKYVGEILSYMLNCIDIQAPDSSGDAFPVTGDEQFRPPSSRPSCRAEPASKGWIGVTWEKYFTGMPSPSGFLNL